MTPEGIRRSVIKALREATCEMNVLVLNMTSEGKPQSDVLRARQTIKEAERVLWKMEGAELAVISNSSEQNKQSLMDMVAALDDVLKNPKEARQVFSVARATYEAVSRFIDLPDDPDSH